MDIQQTLSAGVAVEFSEESDFFYLIDAAQADISIIFYKAGAEVASVVNVGEGYNERFRQQSFDRVRIESTAGGAVHFVTRLGNDVGYQKAPTGEITLGQGTFTNTAKTVTTASASLVAANTARRYLEIQNKDAAGSIFVNVAGVAATTANGRKIGPGESWALLGYVPTGEVFAIGDAASNANIVVIEG